MEGVSLELAYLQENAANLDIIIKMKLSKSLKYFLSRACTTVRDPKLIQQNHYIEDVYSTKSSNSRNVVFSPTKVTLPISVYVNYNLIREIESKLFTIDCKGNIESHPLEVIIPTMIALFSGSSLSNELTYNGSMLIASLILSAEIAIKLSEHGLSRNIRDNIAVALVFSSLMSIDRKSVAYIIEKLLSIDQGVTMRECVELLYMSKYPPHYHRFGSTKQGKNLLELFERPFLNRSVPVKSAAIENMFFSLPNLSPLYSVVSGCLSDGLSRRPFKSLHLSMNSLLLSTGASLWSYKCVGLPTSGDIVDNIRWFIASVVVAMHQSHSGGDLCTMLVEGRHWVDECQVETITKVYDLVSVTMVAGHTDHILLLDVTYDDPSLDTHTIWHHNTLRDTLGSIDTLIEDHMISAMHSVIGAHYTTVTIDHIDVLAYNDDVLGLLQPFFDYPALD